ncbi:MAG TPA: hypothetical protein VIC08_03610, partial [Cellvibrionaceae bacterium]
MEPITIHLKDENAINRHGEAVQIGVPFARGEVINAANIRLHDSKHNQAVTCQTIPMAHWPDGSVRWLKLNFLADMAPHQAVDLQLLESMPDDVTQTFLLKCQMTEREFHIQTGVTSFRVPRHRLDWSA